MSNYRVCLIGAGFISETHAEAISNLPNAKLTAVVDINKKSAQNLANKFSIKKHIHLCGKHA